MAVQQLVVVGQAFAVWAAGDGVANVCVDVGQQGPACVKNRCRRVRDVVQKGVAGAQRQTGGHRGERVALNQHAAIVGRAQDAVRARSAHHQLREAVGATDEFAVLVSCQQRHIEDVAIAQRDAQFLGCLCFDFGPVGDAAASAVEQVARGQWLAVHQPVFA